MSKALRDVVGRLKGELAAMPYSSCEQASGGDGGQGSSKLCRSG